MRRRRGWLGAEARRLPRRSAPGTFLGPTPVLLVLVLVLVLLLVLLLTSKSWDETVATAVPAAVACAAPAILPRVLLLLELGFEAPELAILDVLVALGFEALVLAMLDVADAEEVGGSPLAAYMGHCEEWCTTTIAERLRPRR